jgi:hypothetical protein
MPNNPLTDRLFVVHVRCIRRLLDTAPDHLKYDEDEQAFFELRELIHATGEAFPDVG